MNAPDASQSSQDSSNEWRSLRLTVGGILAATIVGVAWMVWPATPLNDTEHRLVGAWQFQDPQAAGGKSYAYVFHDYRTITGGVVRGLIPQPEWQGKWSIEGTNLSIKRQGIDVPVNLIYQYLGCRAPDRPIPLVWNSEDEITLDRGRKHPDVLVRMKGR